jgi:hypothetical protein
MMETRGVKDREQEEDRQESRMMSFSTRNNTVAVLYAVSLVRLYGLVLDSRMNDKGIPELEIKSRLPKKIDRPG